MTSRGKSTGNQVGAGLIFSGHVEVSGWTSGPIFSGEVRFFPDIDRGTSGGDFENHAEPKKQVFRCF